MTRKFDARMRAIEQKTAMLTRFAPVHVSIRKHLFYDELLSQVEDNNGFVFGTLSSTNGVLNKPYFFKGGFAVTVWL